MLTEKSKIQKYFNSNILNITKMSGGVTNVIYKVVTDENTYILRIYGKKSDLIIDRKIEKKIMDYLNNYNISPKILKEYDDCRIEEYFEGVNNVHPPKYQKYLCKTLKNIHNLPLIDNLPFFWDRFYKWKKQADHPYQKEIDEVLHKIKSINSKYWNQEVLGHGDLTTGNILLKDEQVKLIDYEYSCILPRAFDIANHLCEYEGLESDSFTYPENDIRISLIKNYIEEDIEYNDIFLEIIDYYSLISHYYWGCWSLIQAKISNIDFDYQKYGENRFKMFIHYKTNLKFQ